MVINDKSSFRKSTEGFTLREESILTTKKTAKKSRKSAKVQTLDSLRKSNPISGMGAIGLACLEYLQNNMGEEFTSYEIFGVVGGNSAKGVRDFFRSLGLKKANLNENKGVVYVDENKKDLALVMGKQGAKVTYKMMEVK